MAKEAYPAATVPEDEIQTRYERARQEERDLVHFVGPPELVAQVAAGLAQDIPFDSAAVQAIRMNPTAGGRLTPLGFHTRGKLPGAWEAAGWRLAPGQTSAPFTTPQGTHLVHCRAVRETPYEALRPALLTDIENERAIRRMEDLEGDLLKSARFAPDGATLDALATVLVHHRDSVEATGADPGSVRFPTLPASMRDRSLFTVFDAPFPAAALANELAGVSLAHWPKGSERQELERLLRRRAISAVVDRVARTRGYYDRPDLGVVIERKRRELVMNTLLTELWRGSTISDKEIREFLREQGQDVPGEEGIQLLVQQVKRQREAERLEAYLDTLSVQSDVQYYPERLSQLGERAFTRVPSPVG
jgi:hypothetical protein